MSDKSWTRLAMAAILTGFFLTGLVILPVPFTRDQGIYAYNAWRWLGDAVPYRDTFGHKGPLLYAVYAVSLKISGGAFWGVNLMDLLARTATVFFAFLIGRDLAGRRAGVYSALLTALPLFGLFNSCWWNGQAETFMLPLLTLSAWLTVRLAKSETEDALAVFVAGLLAAQAVALKTSAGTHCLFLFIWLLVRPGRERIRPALYLCLGSAAGILVWVAYFVAKGALADLWEFLFVFNSFHLRSALAAVGLPSLELLADRFWTVFYLIPLGLLLLFVPGGKDRERGAVAFMLLWVLSGAAGIAMQARFFLYHFLILVPAIGVSAGAGLAGLHHALSRFKGRAATVVVVLILAWLTFIFGRAWFLIEESYQTRAFVTGRIGLEQYYSRFSEEDAKGKGDFSLLASAAAAAQLKKMVAPGGTAMIFGYEPLVNYLAGVPAPGRFEIDYPLTFEPHSDEAQKYREKWREQFMAELRANPPQVVIVMENDHNAIEKYPSLVQAAFFEPFWSWLNGNYEETLLIEDFHFYTPRKQ